MPRLRTLLILGRVSNLPTVWSNCLAGWWLGGGGNSEKLLFIFLGASLLYVGGMFLNDAFDVEFDALNRRERPIPSGRISLAAVWRWGLSFLALGAFSLILTGTGTGIVAVALLVCILVYDAIHKHFVLSPVFMAACRFLLYLTAASAGFLGITGTAIWCGLALAFYILGLSYLARTESTRAPTLSPASLLLVAPIVLALILNAGSFRKPALWLSLVLLLWIVWSFAPFLLRDSKRGMFSSISHLLAGIVLVDWLACADVSREFALVFFLLFLATLLFQRFVPAT